MILCQFTPRGTRLSYLWDPISRKWKMTPQRSPPPSWKNWNQLKMGIRKKNKDHHTTFKDTHIPSCETTCKHHQPWISHWIKKSRRKHQLSRKPGEAVALIMWQPFSGTWEENNKGGEQDKVRDANGRVLEEHENGKTKIFYMYIRSLKMGNIGLSPQRSANKQITFSVGMSVILLAKFSQVFTKENPTLITWLGPAWHGIREAFSKQFGAK